MTFDDLLAGADLGSLSPGEIAALLCRLAAVQTRLAARIAESSTQSPDRLLNVDEAAALLRVDPQWVRRRTKTLPFVVRIGGQIRYSTLGIERYLAAKRNAR